jgi:multiple sugar transport system permease protein/raffinose/stachyose/melibiose transport system permease protein
MFDQAYIFSNGSGGPANSTLTVSLMIYRYAFGTQNAMGFAATLAIILAAVIMLLSILAQKANKSQSDY